MGRATHTDDFKRRLDNLMEVKSQPWLLVSEYLLLLRREGEGCGLHGVLVWLPEG